jgi:tetratricopeptide (TPR) repeat protein
VDEIAVLSGGKGPLQEIVALARLQVDHQQISEAVESWKRVLEVYPSDAEALDAVGRLLGKQNKVSELLEVLRRQLALTEDPTRRSALLFQIGSLQVEHQADASAALATFRRLLELNATELLHAGYGVAGDTVLLVAALEAESIDLNELEAVLASFDMALASHVPGLSEMLKA